MALVDSQSRF